MIDLHDLLARNNNNGENQIEGFWIVFAEHTDRGRHYRYRTLEAARAEAERLAQLPDNIGKGICVFEYIGMCKVKTIPPKWEIPIWIMRK